MSIRNNRRTLWLFLIRMEVMNYGETDEVEKSLLFASYIADAVHDIPGGVVECPADDCIFLFSHEAKLKSCKEKN